MDTYDKLFPDYTPPALLKKGGMEILRERILQSILLMLSTSGILFVLYLYQSFTARGLDRLGIAVVVYYVLLVLFTVNRNWNPSFRALLVILLPYIIGIIFFMQYSAISELRFFFAVSTILSAVLMNTGGFIGTITLNLLTMIAFNFAQENGLIFINSTGYTNLNWGFNFLLYLLFGVGAGGAMRILVSNVEQNLSEKEKLASDLESQQSVLEKTIRERTEDVQRRVSQLRTAAEISRAISRITDPDTLLQQVADLIQQRFGLYYVGIFMIEPSHRYAVLQAGTGEAGRTMKEQKHRLLIGGTSMIGWCINNRQPRIALDTGREAVRFNNPLLPNTRSELALPILSREEVLGAMTIQSDQPNAFDQNDIIVLQGIADSLAIAIENSRLFAEMHRNLEEIRSLNRALVQDTWSRVLQEEEITSSEYTVGGAPGEGTNKVNIPITLRDQTLGYLEVELDKHELSEEEATLLEAISTQTALALENARLVRESERRVYQERKLNEITAQFVRAADVESILRTAVEQLVQLPSIAEVSVQLVTPESALETPDIYRNNGQEE